MTKGLEALFMCYLKDRAAAVRELGIERIPQLIKAFGATWINTFVGKLGDLLSKDSNYSTKITVLYSLQVSSIIHAGDRTNTRRRICC